MSPFPYNQVTHRDFDERSPQDNRIQQQVGGQAKQVAVPTTLTTFQISVSGPTLIRFDGFTHATNNADIGSWVFWANLATGVNAELTGFQCTGNYLYLPTAGVYRIGCKQLDSTSPNVILLLYTVFENIDPFIAQVWIHSVSAASSQTGAQVLGAATAAVLGTGGNDPASTAVRDENNNIITHAKQLRIWHAHITNGAGDLRVSVGTDANIAFGEPVPANGILEFPPGSISNSAIYIFSTAGTIVNFTLSYR